MSASSALAAGDPVVGRALYMNTNGAVPSCGNSACHRSDPTTNTNKILRGANNPGTILAAISGNTGGMGFLTPYVSSTDADNIAAYLANPSAGTSAPAISLSATSLAFGNQALTTTSTVRTITVSNTGSASLSISNISTGGTNASDFTRGGTCAIGGTVAAGGSCTITYTFTPGAIGGRSATATITHNATGSPSAITLSGTGTAAPGPAVSLSASTLSFATTSIGSTSASQTVTLTNSGSTALSITALGLAGASPGDFTRGGTCAAGGSVAASASCTIVVAFAPSSTGTITANVSITSNAPGSPHTITLAGTGQPAPVPVVSLSTNQVLFGNQTVGTTSAGQTVTLTNTGAATMTISSIITTDASFARTTTCGASLAGGASCTITLTFTPSTAATITGSLSIATNAAGSPASVGLSGTGIAGGTTLPTVGLSSASLTFAAQTTNTQSASQTVVLTNTGAVTLNITALTLTGSNAAEFARSGTCAAGGSIAAGGTCTLVVTFTPTGLGARTATLNVISNASGAPSVALSGTGTAPPAPAVSFSPASLDFGTVAVGSASSTRVVTVTNSGNATMHISNVSAAGDFGAVSGCGATLAAGASCTVNVIFAPTATGARSSSLTVTSDAPTSPNTATLAGVGGVSTGTTVTTQSGGGASSAGTNVGAGGCAIGAEGPVDPLLPLLAMLSLGALAKRRKPVFQQSSNNTSGAQQ